MCATVGFNVGNYDKHLTTSHIQFLKNVLFHLKQDTNPIYTWLVRGIWYIQLKDIKLSLFHSHKNIDRFKMIRYSHVIR